MANCISLHTSACPGTMGRPMILISVASAMGGGRSGKEEKEIGSRE